MPLTLDQIAAEFKKAFDTSTDGLSGQQKCAVLWEIQGAMGGFPPEPNPYVEPKR